MPGSHIALETQELVATTQMDSNAPDLEAALETQEAAAITQMDSNAIPGPEPELATQEEDVIEQVDNHSMTNYLQKQARQEEKQIKKMAQEVAAPSAKQANLRSIALGAHGMYEKTFSRSIAYFLATYFPEYSDDMNGVFFDGETVALSILKKHLRESYVRHIAPMGGEDLEPHHHVSAYVEQIYDEDLSAEDYVEYYDKAQSKWVRGCLFLKNVVSFLYNILMDRNEIYFPHAIQEQDRYDRLYSLHSALKNLYDRQIAEGKKICHTGIRNGLMIVLHELSPVIKGTPHNIYFPQGGLDYFMQKLLRDKLSIMLSQVKENDFHQWQQIIVDWKNDDAQRLGPARIFLKSYQDELTDNASDIFERALYSIGLPYERPEIEAYIKKYCSEAYIKTLECPVNSTYIDNLKEFAALIKDANPHRTTAIERMQKKIHAVSEEELEDFMSMEFVYAQQLMFVDIKVFSNSSVDSKEMTDFFDLYYKKTDSFSLSVENKAKLQDFKKELNNFNLFPIYRDVQYFFNRYFDPAIHRENKRKLIDQITDEVHKKVWFVMDAWSVAIAERIHFIAPFHISKIFLHALFTPIRAWTPHFKQILDQALLLTEPALATPDRQRKQEFLSDYQQVRLVLKSLLKQAHPKQSVSLQAKQYVLSCYPLSSMHLLTIGIADLINVIKTPSQFYAYYDVTPLLFRKMFLDRVHGSRSLFIKNMDDILVLLSQCYQKSPEVLDKYVDAFFLQGFIKNTEDFFNYVNHLKTFPEAEQEKWIAFLPSNIVQYITNKDELAHFLTGFSESRKAALFSLLGGVTFFVEMFSSTQEYTVTNVQEHLSIVPSVYCADCLENLLKIKKITDGIENVYMFSSLLEKLPEDSYGKFCTFLLENTNFTKRIIKSRIDLCVVVKTFPKSYHDSFLGIVKQYGFDKQFLVNISDVVKYIELFDSVEPDTLLLGLRHVFDIEKLIKSIADLRIFLSCFPQERYFEKLTSLGGMSFIRPLIKNDMDSFLFVLQIVSVYYPAEPINYSFATGGSLDTTDTIVKLLRKIPSERHESFCDRVGASFLWDKIKTLDDFFKLMQVSQSCSSFLTKMYLEDLERIIPLVSNCSDFSRFLHLFPPKKHSGVVEDLGGLDFLEKIIDGSKDLVNFLMFFQNEQRQEMCAKIFVSDVFCDFFMEAWDIEPIVRGFSHEDRSIMFHKFFKEKAINVITEDIYTARRALRLLSPADAGHFFYELIRDNPLLISNAVEAFCPEFINPFGSGFSTAENFFKGMLSVPSYKGLLLLICTNPDHLERLLNYHADFSRIVALFPIKYRDEAFRRIMTVQDGLSVIKDISSNMVSLINFLGLFSSEHRRAIYNDFFVSAPCLRDNAQNIALLLILFPSENVHEICQQYLDRNRDNKNIFTQLDTIQTFLYFIPEDLRVTFCFDVISHHCNMGELISNADFYTWRQFMRVFPKNAVPYQYLNEIINQHVMQKMIKTITDLDAFLDICMEKSDDCSSFFRALGGFACVDNIWNHLILKICQPPRAYFGQPSWLKNLGDECRYNLFVQYCGTVECFKEKLLNNHFMRYLIQLLHQPALLPFEASFYYAFIRIIERFLDSRSRESALLLYPKPKNSCGLFSDPGKRPRLETVSLVDYYELSTCSAEEAEQEIDLAATILFNRLCCEKTIDALTPYTDRILDVKEGKKSVVVEKLNRNEYGSISAWWKQLKEELAHTSSLSQSMPS